jgi:uncharacterized coiled-coil protein SlyX
VILAAGNGQNGSRPTGAIITALSTLSVSLILALIIGYQSFAKSETVDHLEERVRAVEVEAAAERENVAGLEQQVEALVNDLAQLRATVELLYREINPPSNTPVPRG